ncbi:MAG: methyltransferase domain-containing protein [Acidobacteria bacterium]|nr:methyltransferase domain-containing protein [Acidobacteriota bacterium]
MAVAILGAGLLAPALPQLGSRPPKEWIERLERPDRVAKLETERVVSALKVKNGDVVADIGAGSGLFSRPLARAVGPAGKVYAVDINQELLDYTAQRARQEKITNIQTVLGEPVDPKLPPGGVDLIFICDVLHHIEHRQAYLSKLPRYLKPGGRLVILDFAQNWPEGHEEMRFEVADVEAWVKSAGFRRVQAFDFPKDAFFHIYERE